MGKKGEDVQSNNSHFTRQEYSTCELVSINALKEDLKWFYENYDNKDVKIITRQLAETMESKSQHYKIFKNSYPVSITTEDLVLLMNCHRCRNTVEYWRLVHASSKPRMNVSKRFDQRKTT